MSPRIAALPLLALAAPLLSGCVAVAIPALAGTALVGSRIDGEGPEAASASASAPVEAAAGPRPAPTITPTVKVTPATAAPMAPPPAPAPAPAAAIAAPAGAVAAPTVVPVPAGAVAAPTVVPVPAPTAADSIPPSAPADRSGFAQFVRYGRGVAAVSAGASGPLSAMLADPIALDGQRKRCAAGEQPVAVIDLDPAGALFAPPANPAPDTSRALGLAVLREAGVQIAWLSDLPVSQIGAVRTALERAGLDPRGGDIVSLRRDDEDRKQARKEALAANSCIIAIAGDAKPDFDERFQYLKNPEAGAALDVAIGDGWFLIDPVFPVAN